MAATTPLLLIPEDAAAALRIGRTRLFQLLAAGEIASESRRRPAHHPRRLEACGPTPRAG